MHQWSASSNRHASRCGCLRDGNFNAVASCSIKVEIPFTKFMLFLWMPDKSEDDAVVKGDIKFDMCRSSSHAFATYCSRR